MKLYCKKIPKILNIQAKMLVNKRFIKYNLNNLKNLIMNIYNKYKV